MPCLIYFDIPGRAEPTRLAFAIAGVPFEDKRISFEEWGTMKSQPGLPYQQLPALEIDGTHYTQSIALLRYAGALGGLIPSDAKQSMKVDEVVLASEDISILMFATVTAPPEKQKPMRAELSAGKLKTSLETLAAMLEANSPSPYFVGDSITIADLQVYTLVLILESGFLGGFPTDLVSTVAPALKKHHDHVLKHPKVAAYYASKA